jgi:hypothetical protein
MEVSTAILEVARILQSVPGIFDKIYPFLRRRTILKRKAQHVNDVVNATSPKMNIKLVFNLE